MNQSALIAIDAALDVVIEKVDRENEKWVNGAAFPKSQKKIIITALNSFEKEIERFFIQQQKEIISLIRTSVKKNEINPLEGLIEIFSRYLNGNADYLKRLSELYEACAYPLLAKIAQMACNEIISNKNIDSFSEQANKWLKDHKIKFASEVSETTHDSVILTLQTSRSIDDAIQSLMDMPEFDWRRARTTARTETIAAANAGTLEGWRQSEVVIGKEWCCAGGKRSRSSHKKADGQRRKIDEPFIVGGYELMHPGDNSLGAGPEEVCNCRCTMLSLLAADMEGGNKNW